MSRQGGFSHQRQQHNNQLSINAFVNSDETGKVLPRQGSGFPGRAASSRPVGEPGSRCPSLLLSTPAPPPATKPCSPEPCSSPGCVSVWICIPTLGKKGGRNRLLPVSVMSQTCQLALVPAFSSLPCTVPACPSPLSSLFPSPLSFQVDSVCLSAPSPAQTSLTNDEHFLGSALDSGMSVFTPASIMVFGASQAWGLSGGKRTGLT